jgi:hypothetical protein
MKNIHVLPTDKPSRIRIGNNGNFVFGLMQNSITSKNDSYTNQNIYITSDEEIKEGDWYISILENEVYKATKETQNIMSVANLVASTSYKNTHFKIILTDDQDLIKDGVQAIDDEFLEWFVKNPSCEEVDVANSLVRISSFDWRTDYKIIIPKEEPKQETLEEASSRLLYSKYPFHPPQDSGYWKDMFLEGAKWQQEQDKKMYSEEELPKNLESVLAKITHQNDLGLSQWYEVVYYDNDTEKWCCYSGSKTFQDGERVIEWKYCKDCL